MILPIKGMIFRKKNGGDKKPTNTRTYKSFSSKKVSKSHSTTKIQGYITNTQRINKMRLL